MTKLMTHDVSMANSANPKLCTVLGVDQTFHLFSLYVNVKNRSIILTTSQEAANFLGPVLHGDGKFFLARCSPSHATTVLGSYGLMTYQVLVEESFPLFSEVARILHFSTGNVYLLIRSLKTVGFDQHYHSHVVSPTDDDYVAVQVDELVDHHPLSTYAVRKANGGFKLMVPVHYRII